MPDQLSTSKELAGYLGGGGGVGYQILKIRRPRKQYPDWVNNNEKIAEILFRSFPRMRTDPKQRTRAGRWARIIYLFYRRQWTRGQIAEELKLKYKRVDDIIYGINLVARGLRFDGRGKLSKKRRKHEGIQT